MPSVNCRSALLTAPPHARRVSLAAALAFLFLAISLASNLWLALTLLPSHVLPSRISPSPWLQWPNGWHAWLVQFTALLIAALYLALRRLRPALSSWWAIAHPTARAAAACVPLIATVILFGAGFWITRNYSVSDLGYLRAFFWLGGEFNPSTTFAVAQLWLLAGLAWACRGLAQASGLPARAYSIAAVLCLYLGTDELLSIHEAVGGFLRNSGWLQISPAQTFGLGSLQVFSWTLVYGPLAVILGVFMARRFYCDLPRDGTFTLLVIASLVFLTGAVGFETVNSNAVAHGRYLSNSDSGHLNMLVEETMEMLGVTIAVFALARCFFGLAARNARVRPAADGWV